MTWQPISTAPKDGTIIDVWIRGERQADVKWKKGAWHVWGMDGYDGMDWVTLGDPAPTHWMPLPPPPEPNLLIAVDEAGDIPDTAWNNDLAPLIKPPEPTP